MEKATAELRLAAQLATHAAQALPADSADAALYEAAAKLLVVEADCHEVIPRINGAVADRVAREPTESFPEFPIVIYVSTLGPVGLLARAVVAHIQRRAAGDTAEEGPQWPFTTTM